MLFQKFSKREDGWVIIDYTATWKYGYDFILDAAQGFIDNDLRDNLQRAAVAEQAGTEQTNVTEALKAAGNALRACPETAKECGMLTVAGISGIMQVPVQLVFFNQTNLVRVVSPIGKYFEENGEHVFDNYLNSVEIQAHCAATERRVRKELSGEE
ncbi:MAG: hypothetical protein IKP95_12330 [Ruminococcus sp.]|nr:hypothetical protein [Ruminococcus sp.]